MTTDSLGQYMEGLDRARLLTAEEEVELAQAIEAGVEARTRLEEEKVRAPERASLQNLVDAGEAARKHFIEANLRLVVSNARRYATSELDMLDLIQEGNIGLITAVEKFDWKKGFKFSTYATWWIRQAMQRARANLSDVIRIPSGVYDILPTVRSASDQIRTERGRAASPEEIADVTGLAVREVEKALAVSATMSLEMPIGEDGGELGDVLADDQATDPEREAEIRALNEAVESGLEDLPDTHRQVVDLRFGLTGGRPATLAQIGEITGLSQRELSTVLSEALADLHRRLESMEDMRVA
ncbi:MAG: sigma-70 family RNA polymerase sigma factor [Acidimicrobiia bacterium]